MECYFWVKLLTRIVAVIQFLGLLNNRNYLGCLELIAKFDDFPAEHIHVHDNAGRGGTHQTSLHQFVISSYNY